MKNLSELGATFPKVTVIVGLLGCVAAYGIYWYHNESNKECADEIINNVFLLAKQGKAKIDTENPLDSDVTMEQTYDTEQQKYSFTVKVKSSSKRVTVETGKKPISPAVCEFLKEKFTLPMWEDAFDKVVTLDETGTERTDVLTFDCPEMEISSLRFYLHFNDEQLLNTEADPKEKTSSGKVMPPPVASKPTPSTPYKSSVESLVSSTSTSTSRPTCPAGTSASGAGDIATSGCRCNGVGESWNGHSCEAKGCPPGSSRNASGNLTSVSGCRCNTETPVWSKDRCVAKCSGNTVPQGDRCACPDHMVLKTGAADVCVECNENADCGVDYICISNQCIHGDEQYKDCRWGVCQTCDGEGNRTNMDDTQECEVGGLPGMCNGNGTCYPIKGRRCSSRRACPDGSFCNYGGNLNTSKRQQGVFGQTANVCQQVSPEEFTHERVTYYYNSEKDLKSWCRAANNKPNCKWGYLAKQGAESWCASLGKRLLTKAEMGEVWNVLRKHLPKTYTGYAYWVQEGVWLEDQKGRRAFGQAHPDGYRGRGGVVCK